MITNKTIEFIEKEINICNQSIDFQTQVAFESQTNQFKKRYRENEALKLTEKLQSLKQIKAELEAWEVVKEKNVKIGLIRTSPNFEVYDSLFNEDTPKKWQITKKEYETIIKVLEVE